MAHVSAPRDPSLLALLALVTAACDPAGQTPSALEIPDEPDAYLWKKYVGGEGQDGYATAADVEDAFAYYARASVGLAGRPGISGDGVVPETLEAFKIQFNIPTREVGEDVATYRARIGAAVYYNQNELGLGRELACSAASPETGGEPGFLDSDGVSVGVACFVTNYVGPGGFYDPNGAMANATSADPQPKNTVAITYRPTQPEHERVQFWVYGSTNQLQGWAQLDHREGMLEEEQWRAVPSVCTNCHGGSYTQGEGVAQDAHFLPASPFAVDLSASPEGIHNRLREANCTAYRSNSLTPLQLAWMRSLYNGVGPCESDVETELPLPGWEDDADVWTQAAAPYCGSCHLALPETPLLEDAETFRAVNIVPDVCGIGERGPVMPHALPTFRRFWAGDPSPASLILEAHTGDPSCP